MSSNLQNSIWPNAGGTLGQIKVQIPTGTDNDTIKWPTGDALVHNFVFNKGKLVGFVDTKALIANDSKTTIFPYDYVNIFLPSIAEGEMTYNYDQCTYVVLNGEVLKGDVPTNVESINKKYLGCKTVEEIQAIDSDYLVNDIIDGVWSQSLADLEYGCDSRYTGLFDSCETLTSFNSDLSSLINGDYMFYWCENIKSFSADLPNMTSAEGMFDWCEYLESFSADSNGTPVNLSKLTNGSDMFRGCKSLTSFSSNLSNLENGYCMFGYCDNFTSFNSDLSSLTDGEEMFECCKLDTASVQNIADTINTYDGEIYIGIGNSTPNEQEIAAFNTMVSKGWTVYVGVNGDDSSQWNPTSLTPENGEETVTPIPYWAKPVPSDEKHARYVDSEGNFYNIVGGNYIYGDNLENYGMFTSKEDAAAQMRLTKIEK